MGNLRNLGLWLKSLQITVEPLMFILAAANTARGIVTPSLSEAKMKRVYAAPPHLSGKDLDKFYNKKMVLWDNNYEYVNLPIACIVGIIYGGYSDHKGRKLPLLVGIMSVLYETAMRMLIWSESTDLPLYWLYPTAVIAGLLGDFLLTMSCINAYVADQFEDKIVLSYRMVVVSIIFSLGSFASSQLTKHVVKWTSEIAVLGIAEGMLLFSLMIGILMLKQQPPNSRKKELIYTEDELAEVLPVEVPPAVDHSLLEIVKISFISLYDSVKIFVQPRKGHRRLFLYMCFFANFLDQFVFGEEKGLIGTYTRLSPFKWDTDEYANYKTLRPLVQIAGMFVGMLIFKRILHLRDTMIICIAIGSMGLCVLMIGLAQASWVIFASLAPGGFHGLLNPMSYTFMACLVEQDEIGKAYAVSSIAQKLAGIAQAATLQNIYIATVDWYQGFVWLLMSGLSYVAVAVYAVVHVVAKKENIGS
ncbi:unnamed protein product [Caenorhabditis auriculariae]|uniref:Major facilitator superfamily (MFS) profile domain-containing protein n=1 Tax=Caenorhabditis auriculariae TaxID=2777116 RepID=A0A8S1HGI0_9PELO|nr:unnamed protein product [Caenorhabditis auriculariae]